jgi:phage-related protein
LSKEAKKAIGEDIKTIQYGWPLGMPLVRKIGPSLWEVRTALKDGWSRIFFTAVGGEIVLLHGFFKASRKIPKQELDAARKRLSYISGTGHGTKARRKQL